MLPEDSDEPEELLVAEPPDAVEPEEAVLHVTWPYIFLWLSRNVLQSSLFVIEVSMSTSPLTTTELGSVTLYLVSRVHLFISTSATYALKEPEILTLPDTLLIAGKVTYVKSELVEI